MKRKIFSKLLMVALVIAAVGSFVSCKDYDDDINNLQKQIDAKAAISELTALQSTLEGKISTATAAAQKAAEDAAAKADASLKAALETAIADAKKAGTDAGTQAGTAIAAANKAQETADAAAQAAKDADAAAKKDLADALKTIEETYQTKAEAAAAATEAAKALADVKAIADAAYTKAEAEKLQEQVNGLKADLESTIEEKVAEAIKNVNNAVASVDAIWGAVTSLELVPSQYGSGALRNSTLYFLKGTEVNNAFGAAVIPAGNAAMSYDGHEVSEIKNYKAGDEIKFDNRIVVRVNPVNATFTADDVVLIDSKGNTLNDLVAINVEKYNQLITRGDYENGLWTISFTRKAGVTEADFQKATEGEKYDAKKKPLCAGDIVYAIAINNSKDAAETRYAATTFDVDVFYGDYVRPNDFEFNVIDVEGTKGIANLHNRWSAPVNKLIGEDETAEIPVAGKWNAELKWAPKSDDNASVFANHVDTASVAGQTEAKYRNWEYGTVANGEARYGEKTYVVVDADQRTFTINGIEKSLYRPGLNLDLVQWYYVTLDKFAAVESAPSEWESWNSYSYDGLYTVTPAIDRLRITINSEAAVGDIIGFRVFAVNYDGSLADPDGRAFYVKVGEPAEFKAQTATAQYVAYMADGGAAATDALIAQATGETDYNWAVVTAAQAGLDLSKFKKLSFTHPSKPAFNVAANGAATIKATAGAIDADLAGARYALLKTYNAETGEIALATKWEEINYIAFGTRYCAYQVDGTIATTNIDLKGYDPDHHDALANELKISVKKVMPTAPLKGDVFSWKDGAGVSGNNLTLYMLPVPAAVKTEAAYDWTQSATWGVKDLAQLCNMGTANYRFIFANARDNDAVGLAYETLVNPGTTATKSSKVVVDAAAAAVGPNTTAGTYVLALEGPATQADATKRKIGKSSNLDVQYEYLGISRSATQNPATGAWTYFPAAIPATHLGNDTWVNVDSKSVTFSYALAENTYSWTPYYYASSWTLYDATVPTYMPTFATSTKFEIPFLQVGAHTALAANAFVNATDTETPITGGGTSAHASYVAGSGSVFDVTAPAAVSTVMTNALVAANALSDNFAGTTISTKILRGIKVANAKFAQWNGNLDALLNVAAPNAPFVANGYDENGQAGITTAWNTPIQVRFVSKGTGVQEYYQTVGNATAVYFAGVSATDVPLTDVASQLVIKAKDAFGFEKTIFSGDILLKK